MSVKQIGGQMKENKKIRLFVAVSLPSAVQQAIVRESFVLMKSELGGNGPKYTERARYLLVR